MASSLPTEGGKKSLLEPMNLHNPTEFDELLRQRIICGWDFTRTAIESWRANADTKSLANFWVVPEALSELPAPQRYAGHISMASKTEPPNETPIRVIANLFVLPEHRLGGIGRAAVQELESWAKIEPYGTPGCKAITLNAISRKYIEDDAEEWRGMYSRVCEGLQIPLPRKGTGNEDWYLRMGYVKYGEEPRYSVKLDGKDILLLATLLRKDLP